MKVTYFTCTVLAFVSIVDADAGSPMSKVFEMLSDLQKKTIAEGADAQKVYDEFKHWCNDRSANVGFEIQTGKAEVEELSATIEKETSKITAYTTKVEDLSASISKSEADLSAAANIRKSETADFEAEEKELSDVIATLERAIAVLKRELQKGSASLLETKGIQSISKAMEAMVNASVLSSADASRLLSLSQTAQASEEDDSADAQSAPDPASYQSHNDGIIGTLENLLDKAQAQLEQARKTEAADSHHFEMLKQSLEGEIAAGQRDLDATKRSIAECQEAKATAEGDLAVTSADLKEDTDTLNTVHHDCESAAEDFQAETKSRGDALNALAQAKKVLGDALPAAAHTYGAALDQAFFLQLAEKKEEAQVPAHFEAVRFIRDLARKEHSTALAQLASKMSSVLRFGASAGDPIAKVKTLISEMIAKLEKDALADLTHKGFCDKETSETKSKKDEKSYAITKLSTKVDSMTAQSAKLKEAIATLQKELAELASAQVLMEQVRSEEKALYSKNTEEMEAGITGIQRALSILRDYYGQGSQSQGSSKEAGGKILSLLEEVESDFTRGLTEIEVAETTAAKEYEKTSTMNKIATAAKQKDVGYKAKEAASLAKSAAEASSDRDGVQAELDALFQYLDKLGKMCIAKTEPYAERKARQDAEIAGLKQALALLEGEAVLLQKSSKKAFRGSQLN